MTNLFISIKIPHFWYFSQEFHKIKNYKHRQHCNHLKFSYSISSVLIMRHDCNWYPPKIQYDFFKLICTRWDQFIGTVKTCPQRMHLRCVYVTSLFFRILPDTSRRNFDASLRDAVCSFQLQCMLVHKTVYVVTERFTVHRLQSLSLSLTIFNMAAMSNSSSEDMYRKWACAVMSSVQTTPPHRPTSECNCFSTTEVNNNARVVGTQRIICVYIPHVEFFGGHKLAFLPILQAFYCDSELKHCTILHPDAFKFYFLPGGGHPSPKIPHEKSLAAYLAAISFKHGHVVHPCNVVTLFEWNLNRTPQYYSQCSFFCVAYVLRITFNEKKTWKKSNLMHGWHTLTLFLNAHGLCQKLTHPEGIHLLLFRIDHDTTQCNASCVGNSTDIRAKW